MDVVEQDNFGYSEEVMDLLERLRVNCVNLNAHYRNRYFHFKAFGKYFRIPIICLSIFSASASVGLQSLEVEQKIISGVTCIIALAIAMLSAIELHLSISDKLEDSYKYSKKFYSLSTELYRVIKLRPEDRSTRGPDFLGAMYTEYTKLMESSEMMRHSMKNDVLTRIPKALREYKRTPTLTPIGSLEDSADDKEIFSHFPHSASIIFSPKSPTIQKQYYESPFDQQDVNVTDIDIDVESNLSK